MRKLTKSAAVITLAAAIAASQPPSVPAASRNGLWAVVHDLCVPLYRGIGVPFPCREVNLNGGAGRGFAVLRTASSPSHFILVPTARVSGIESPLLQSEEAPNYWQAAWDARHLVEEGAGRPLPRDAIGMAVNSAAGRSQDQLHIHVACVLTALTGFLRSHELEIHGSWSRLRSTFAGHKFLAMKIEAEDLGKADPFRILPQALGPGGLLPKNQTLAVIGAVFRDGRPGFYLLANDARAHPLEVVSAEGLLDDKCAKRQR